MAATIEPTTEFGLPDHVLSRELDGAMVLLDLETDTYFSVEGPAADFVGELDNWRSIERAVTHLVETYDATSETLTSDLLRLAGELVEAGLLVRT